jgi:hypothetical protein
MFEPVLPDQLRTCIRRIQRPLIAACFRFGVQRRLTPCETECRLDPANAPALALLATALLRAREAPDAVAASRRAGDQQTDLTNRGPRDWQVRP